MCHSFWLRIRQPTGLTWYRGHQQQLESYNIQLGRKSHDHPSTFFNRIFESFSSRSKPEARHTTYYWGYVGRPPKPMPRSAKHAMLLDYLISELFPILRLHLQISLIFSPDAFHHGRRKATPSPARL